MNRVRAAIALEWTVQWRYRVPAVAVAVTAVWTVALSAMPDPVARGAGPLILTIDTATFGSFFVAALVLFERGEGAAAALAVSPLRFGEYLGAKVGTLTALSAVSAVPVALVSGVGPGTALVGVVPLAVLFLVLNLALVTRHDSLVGFLTVAPVLLVPLIAAPLVHLSGVVDHPLLFLVPTTGAASVLRGGTGPVAFAGAMGYLLVAVAVGLWFARRSHRRSGAGVNRVRVPREHRRRWTRRGWLIALVDIDRRLAARSALLTVVLAGPVLLAAALRLGYPPLAGYAHERFGVDLVPYQPVLLASLVVLHVPLIVGMVGALLVLDDVDDHVVLVLRVSPVTMPRYLAYRAVAVAVVTAALLAVTVPLSGLAPDLSRTMPGLALAAAQAPLVTLATAAFARNKVEGLAWLKILGLLPTVIAPAVWWLPELAQWPLRILPYYWTVDLLWRPGPLSLLAGLALTAVAVVLLSRRTLRRLNG